MILKQFLLSSFLFLCTLPINAQKTLSKRAEISILTLAPGSNLYDSFGHSAIRIKDSLNRIDVVYNYGIYNFNQPNFYLNFAKGKLMYSMGANYFDDFYNAYKYENRTIYEQILNLNQTEKQTIYAVLYNNYEPENRDYLYDFFYNNCATKIRDIICDNSKSSIIFNEIDSLKTKTFRNLINQNLPINSWGHLGINIALGAVIDRPTTPYSQQFLPQYVHTYFNEATYKDTQEKIVVKDTILYKAVPSRSNFQILSPFAILTAISLFILYITYTDYKKNKKSSWLDGILFAVTGIIGIVLLLLWFATNHTATAYNYNLLWAFALNIFFVPQIVKTTVKPWLKKYLFFLILMLVLLTFHWVSKVQTFSIVLVPLLIALAIRYVFLIFFCYRL